MAPAHFPTTFEGHALLPAAGCQRHACTGRSGRYQLEKPRHAIGDRDFIDADTALLIERDNGDGDAREFGTNEANEFILLRVPELLRAR